MKATLNNALHLIQRYSFSTTFVDSMTPLWKQTAGFDRQILYIEVARTHLKHDQSPTVAGLV